MTMAWPIRVLACVAVLMAYRPHCVISVGQSRRTFVVDIDAVGGVGDGQTMNTVAFTTAIAAIADAGGGTLVLPPGLWRTAPFNLTSHMTLYLKSNATLLASTDEDDWPIIPPLPSYGQGRDHPGPRRTSFLHGEHLDDVTITGDNGTIDGQGMGWWQRHKAGKEKYTRGHLIECMWCTDVEVSGLTLTNSPFWTVHPYSSRNFVARDLTILHPTNGSAPNTDGIDPDSTKDVIIERVYIRTGDDAIAIKSGWDEYGYTYNVSSSNITIRDSVLSSPCCAGICVGSEMSGGVEDVFTDNVTIVNTAEAVRLKTGVGRGGYIRNINFDNITVDVAKEAFTYRMDYGGHPAGWNASALPAVYNVAARDVVGSGCDVGVDLWGLGVSALRGITFENVHLDGPWKCANVSGTVHDVSPPACSELTPTASQRPTD